MKNLTGLYKHQRDHVRGNSRGRSGRVRPSGPITDIIIDELVKVQEVKRWIRSSPTTPPIEDVKSYIDRRWPELQSDLRENIFIVALGESF